MFSSIYLHSGCLNRQLAMFNNKMSQITGCSYLSFQLPQTLLGGRLPSCRIFHPFIRPDKFHLFTSQQFSYKKVPRTRTTRLAWLTIVLAQSLGKANESRMGLIFFPFQLFVLCTASQIIGGDFAKFCGLLKIYELYLEQEELQRCPPNYDF